VVRLVRQTKEAKEMARERIARMAKAVALGKRSSRRLRT
jgi:hypothetical protein